LADVPPHLRGSDGPRDRGAVAHREAHHGAPHAPAGTDDSEAHQRDARPGASAAVTAATTAARVLSSTGTRGSRTVARIAPFAARAAFTGPGFASMNIASWTGISARCARRASSSLPSRARRVARVTWAGRTFDVTLMTPLAPTAIIGRVSASSPLRIASRSPKIWASFCARRTLPVASFTPTTFG